MKEDFICNDMYTDEVFKKVSMLRNSKNWDAIDNFMCKEYRLEWIRYKEGDLLLKKKYIRHLELMRKNTKKYYMKLIYKRITLRK